MKNKPLSGLWKIISFKSTRLTLCLLVFGVTCWLVHGGHLGDAAFATVVPILITHLILDHRERLLTPMIASSASSAAPPPTLPNRGQL